MKGISDYAVIYDISSDGERTKIEKILKNYGFRIQKSVFECRMDNKTKGELIERLEGLDITTGFVKIYKQERRKFVSPSQLLTFLPSAFPNFPACFFFNLIFYLFPRDKKNRRKN